MKKVIAIVFSALMLFSACALIDSSNPAILDGLVEQANTSQGSGRVPPYPPSVQDPASTDQAG